MDKVIETFKIESIPDNNVYQIDPMMFLVILVIVILILYITIFKLNLT